VRIARLFNPSSLLTTGTFNLIVKDPMSANRLGSALSYPLGQCPESSKLVVSTCRLDTRDEPFKHIAEAAALSTFAVSFSHRRTVFLNSPERLNVRPL
jgi:hypothetical protein